MESKSYEVDEVRNQASVPLLLTGTPKQASGKPKPKNTPVIFFGEIAN